MDNNITSLYIACEERNIKEIKSILSTCNKIDEEAYFLVCSNGDIEILDLILNYSRYANKLDIHIGNEYALKIACKNNRLEIIDYLIRYGELNNSIFLIHVDVNEIIKIVCKNNYFNILKYLLKYLDGCPKLYYKCIKQDILYYSIESNNIELIKYMIEYIVSHNKFFITNCIAQNMFVLACEICNEEILEYLLYTFNLNIYESNGQYHDYACINNNTNALNFLIKYSIEKNLIHKLIIKYTDLLYYAHCKGNIDVINLLIDYSNKENIEINIPKINNKLFVKACMSGNIELVKLYIKSICRKYKTMKGALFIAFITQQYDVVKYLLYLIPINILTVYECDKIFQMSFNSGNIDLIKLILTCKWDLKFHINKDTFLNSKPNHSQLSTFLFLLDYFKQIDYTPNICNNLNKLLRNAYSIADISLINFLLYYNQETTNKIISTTLPYINNTVALNMYIEYCYKYNIAVDLYISSGFIIQILFQQSMQRGYKMLKYFMYLIKHNYNNNKQNLFIFTQYNDIIPLQLSNIIHFVLCYPELIVTRKYICNNITIKCNHLYKFVINNNIICLECNHKLHLTNNYTLYFC